MNGGPDPDAETGGIVGKHEDAPTCTTPPPPPRAELIEGFPNWLGSYRRDERLGKGGMGVVFRYRDTRLDRLVAVKSISTQHAGDPVWRQRFEREAKLLAKLDHPHIAKIFHLLEHGGVDYLILEYVPGETLQARLYDGPLEMETALRVAHQIASAIAAGHGQGIVHRDIKPGNVMVTALDTVKVLDYGLARPQPEAGRLGSRARDRDANDDRAEGSDSELWGTPGYMSPEQVSGETVDQRTDVWAFGCVLYDCLTGRRAFPGNRHQRRIATLTREPDWSLLPANTPPQVRQMLEGCLCKDVSQRLPDLRETCAELEHAAAAVAPRRPVREIPGNLSTPLTSYVARDGELQRLKHLVASNRLLTLTGPGGCGKTRLSIALAEAIRDDARAVTAGMEFADGIWFVELAALASADLVPQAVAATLWGSQGISRSKGRTILNELEDDLADRSLLLVLDNCEHQVPGCVALITRLLTRCPSVKVIATSRIGLGVEGEQTYPVPGLSFPGQGVESDTDAKSEDESSVRTDITAYEAIRLFIERACRVQPNFAVDQTNAAAISRICQRLEGIPLAVELAAARIQSLPVTDVADRLFEVLDRDHILQASIDSSVEVLDSAQRTLLGRLSVFRGGWTLEAAESICSDKPKNRTVKRRPVVELLGDLVERSLVVYSVREDRARYHLLETVREHAATMLKPKPLLQLRRRHLGYFMQLAHEADAHFADQEQTAWLNRLESELDNLRGALDLSLGGDDRLDDAAELARDLHMFWYIRGYLSEARRALDQICGLRGSVVDLLQMQVFNAAGTIAARQADAPGAQRFYHQSLQIAQKMGDERRAAGISTNLGRLYQDSDLQESRRHHERAMRLYGQLGDDTGVAMVQLNLAYVARVEGRLDEARDLIDRCLPRFQDSADQQRIASAFQTLGELHDLVGRYAEAEAAFRQSLAVSHELGDRPAVACSMLWLGASAAHRGIDDQRAARLLAASELIRDAANTPHRQPDAVEYEQSIALVTERLPANELRQARESVGELTLDELVDLGLDSVGG